MKANPPEVVKRFSADDQARFPRTIIPFEDSNKLLFLGRRVEGPHAAAPAAEQAEKARVRSFCGY